MNQTTSDKLKFIFYLYFVRIYDYNNFQNEIQNCLVVFYYRYDCINSEATLGYKVNCLERVARMHPEDIIAVFNRGPYKNYLWQYSYIWLELQNFDLATREMREVFKTNILQM